MSVSRITTHILDTTRGQPAVGVSVRLAVQAPDGWQEIDSAITNNDGRIMALGPAELASGSYRIEIETGAYYRRTETESFFTSVCLSFTVRDASQHYHVPLLISPFALSTYRGS